MLWTMHVHATASGCTGSTDIIIVSMDALANGCIGSLDDSAVPETQKHRNR